MTTNSSVGPEHRQRDPPEPHGAGGAVDRGRLVELLGDPLQPGGDEDEREPEAGPHARDRDRPQRRVGIAEQTRILERREQVVQPSDVGEHADLRLQQEQPHQARHRDRRGHRRGEDRAEGADPAQRLVGEHGEADAQRQPERDGDQRQLERRPQRVLELDRAEHVDVLVPPVRAAVAALDVAALAAEHDRPDQRIDDEHGEHDDRRCQQQQRRRQLLPTLPSVAVGRHAATLGEHRRSAVRGARPAAVRPAAGRRAGRVASVSDATTATTPAPAAPVDLDRVGARPRGGGGGARTPRRRHVLDRRDHGRAARPTNCSPPTRSLAGVGAGRGVRRGHGEEGVAGGLGRVRWSPWRRRWPRPRSRRGRRPPSRRSPVGFSRTVRVWRLSTRNAARFAAMKVRRVASPAERRAELDEQFAIRTAEDVAKQLGEMKGVLMKAGQLVSFIFETLPEDAQAALATLAGRRRADVAVARGRRSSKSELGAAPERVFLDWSDLPVAAASIGQVHRAVTHDGRRRRGQGAVPGRRRRDRERPRRGRGDVRDVLGDDAQGARRQVARRRAPRAACARSSTTSSRRRTSREFGQIFAGHPWVRVPRLVPELSTAPRAHHRVGRRHVVRGVPAHRQPGHQAARRRGDLAVRPARRAPPRRVQRRPASGQLQVPPRRQRDVPRLRARQALVAGRVGDPGSRRSTRSSSNATRSGSWRRWRRAASCGAGHGLDAELVYDYVSSPYEPYLTRRVHVLAPVDDRHDRQDVRRPGSAPAGDRGAQHAGRRS